MFTTTNLIEQYKDTFLNLSAKLADLEGCIGVVLGGGVGRGWYDRVGNQDIDFYLYFRNEYYCRYLEKEGFNPNWPWVIDAEDKGLNLSIQFLDFDALWVTNPEPVIWLPDDHRWTQSNRWDKLNSQIIIDKKKSIRHLFRKKIIFPNEEITILSKEFEKQIKDIFWGEMLSCELRGLVVEANIILSKCIDIFINWIYVKNKLFIPPEKWKFWWLRTCAVGDVNTWIEIQDMYTVGDMNSLEELIYRKGKFKKMVSNFDFELSRPVSKKNNTMPEWLKSFLLGEPK